MTGRAEIVRRDAAYRQGLAVFIEIEILRMRPDIDAIVFEVERNVAKN